MFNEHCPKLMQGQLIHWNLFTIRNNHLIALLSVVAIVAVVPDAITSTCSSSVAYATLIVCSDDIRRNQSSNCRRNCIGLKITNFAFPRRRHTTIPANAQTVNIQKLIVKSTTGKPNVVSSFSIVYANTTFQYSPSPFSNSEGTLNILPQGLQPLRKPNLRTLTRMLDGWHGC